MPDYLLLFGQNNERFWVLFFFLLVYNLPPSPPIFFWNAFFNIFSFIFLMPLSTPPIQPLLQHSVYQQQVIQRICFVSERTGEGNRKGGESGWICEKEKNRDQERRGEERCDLVALMTHWHPQTFYVSVCLCVVVQISCNHSTLRHTHAHTHKYTHAPLPPSAPRGTGRARSRMVPLVEQVFFCDVLTSTACCHFRFKWMSQIEHTHIYKLSVFSSPSELAETR